MNKLIYLLIIIILSGCSLNKNSKFWTKSEKISKETKLENKILKEEFHKVEDVLDKEFNENRGLLNSKKLKRTIAGGRPEDGRWPGGCDPAMLGHPSVH